MAVKHGIKSTEFYVTMLALILLGVNLYWPVPENLATENTIWSVIGMLGVVAIYNIGRMMIKSSK